MFILSYAECHFKSFEDFSGYTYEKWKKEGELFRFSVTDTGSGIKQEELADIWDRYYRVDKGHQRSIQGSGLGLSIIKGILEYHKFTYGVESKIGEGSTFYFKAPIKRNS